MNLKSALPGLLGLMLGLAGAASAWAQDAGKELANKNGCMSCHDIGTKVIGPSFIQVAEKYRGQKDAAQVLAQKVREGGKGNWGRVPMPPHPQIKDAELASLITWVLAQK